MPLPRFPSVVTGRSLANLFPTKNMAAVADRLDPVVSRDGHDDHERARGLDRRRRLRRKFDVVAGIITDRRGAIQAEYAFMPCETKRGSSSGPCCCSALTRASRSRLRERRQGPADLEATRGFRAAISGLLAPFEALFCRRGDVESQLYRLTRFVPASPWGVRAKSIRRADHELPFGDYELVYPAGWKRR